MVRLIARDGHDFGDNLMNQSRVIAQLANIRAAFPLRREDKGRGACQCPAIRGCNRAGFAAGEARRAEGVGQRHCAARQHDRHASGQAAINGRRNTIRGRYK
jgi:hypothetical protein